MNQARWWSAAWVLSVFAGAAPGQTIEGRVVEDHTGRALASADVRMFRAGVTGLAADLETDPEGRFSAPGLPAGEYRIEVSKPSYLETHLRLRFAPNARAAALTVRLVRCGTIAGQVTDSEGRPVRDATVFAMVKLAGSGPWQAPGRMAAGNPARVDDRGQYRLYNLPPGQYSVAVSYGLSGMGTSRGRMFYPDNVRPEVFTISGGEEFRADLIGISGAAYTVSGRVDSPKAGSYGVSLVSSEQPTLAFAILRTDETGAFRFEGIPPGSYDLFASGPTVGYSFRGAALQPEPLFGRIRVEVAGQNVEGLSVPVGEGRTASFVLRGADEKSCPATAQLVLSPVEDWGAMLFTTADVSAGKEQTVRGLAPTRYEAAVTKLGDNCYQARSTIIDLTAGGDSKRFPIAIASAGSIRGRLAGAERPADFAIVLATADAVDRAPPVQVALPDRDARFSFAALRPGRYWIAARPASEARTRWLPDLRRMFEIEVAGGVPTDMDLPAPAVKEKQ